MVGDGLTPDLGKMRRGGFDVDGLLQDGWTLEMVDWSDGESGFRDAAVYHRRVYAEYAVKDGLVYSLPEELKKVFWVDDVTVAASMGGMAVAARGFHPHIACGRPSDSLVFACAGDLKLESVASARKVPDVFRCINYGQFLSIHCMTLVKMLFDGEYAKNVLEEPMMRKTYFGGMDDVFEMFKKHAGCFEVAEPDGEVFGDSEPQGFDIGPLVAWE